MRTAFVQSLINEAELDQRIILLTGDLGFMALEPFRDRFPDRFYNMGVAEQNMIGVATGLAEAGFIPFCYSIVPFAVSVPPDSVIVAVAPEPPMLRSVLTVRLPPLRV